MSYKNVQVALDVRLSTLASASTVPIAWEGTNYEAVTGTPFLRTTNITAVSNQLDLSGEPQNNVGIYQVDVFYPIRGEGTGPMLDLINEIFDHFKAELTLTSNGTKTYIRQTCASNLELVQSKVAVYI